MNSWISVIFLFAGLLSISYLFFDVLLPKKYKSKNGCRLPPGPWGLPILGHLHLLGAQPHLSLHKLANKFGPIMHIRLGLVPTIVVSSPEAAELVLKTHDLVFASRPKVEATEFISYEQRNLLFAEYGPRWRNIRKLCTSLLLNCSKVESMKSTRNEDVKGLVTWLVNEAELGNVVDFSAKVGSVIQDMALKTVVGCGNYDKFSFKSNIEEMMALIGAFNISDFIPFLALFDFQGLRRRLKISFKVVDGFLDNIIDEHVPAANKRANNHKDFMDVMFSLMEPTDGQGQLDRDTMKAIILDMIAGSMDTSPTAIEWTLSELLRNPRVMEKVQLELENVVGMTRIVEESDLVKLEYLDFVIKETLRLHPVGPLLAPHESIEDITMNGYYIPKKTRLIINAWAIGRDPHAWSPNPDEFYPERFIGCNTDFRGNDLRFVPFGSGRRGCVGTQLGLTVIRLVIAQLVHCFNWELPNGMSPDDLDMTEKFGLTLPRANHLLAKPTFRLRIQKV